jgi:hypothetical protein
LSRAELFLDALVLLFRIEDVQSHPTGQWRVLNGKRAFRSPGEVVFVFVAQAFSLRVAG